MQRFTISLDDALAERFDALIAERGYVNRSEAVRDLIRERLGHAALDTQEATWCAATASYVYDHHDRTVTERVLSLQHDHHDLVVSSVHTHLDHHHCLETAVLRGPAAAVRACAEQLVALRGVRNGHVHIVPLHAAGPAHVHPDPGTEPGHHPHGHGHADPAARAHDHSHPPGTAPHVHLKPIA